MPEPTVPGPEMPASPTYPDPVPLIPRSNRTMRGRPATERALSGATTRRPAPGSPVLGDQSSADGPVPGGPAPEDGPAPGGPAPEGCAGFGPAGSGPAGSGPPESGARQRLPRSARPGSDGRESGRRDSGRPGSDARQPGPAARQPGSGRQRSARPKSGRRPLPDAQAICSFRVPEIAPPYDDAAATRNPARPTARRRLTSIAAPPQPRETQPQRAQPHGTQPDRTQPPQTGAWPSQFAQVLAETLVGSRPASQMVPWTTEQTRRRISKLGPMLATAHQPRVRRVIVTSPASGVLEMTVILALGDHVRAVAVRLERARPGQTGTPVVRDNDRVPPSGQTGTPAGTAFLPPALTPPRSSAIGGTSSAPEQVPTPAARPVRTRNNPYNGYRRSQAEWLCTAIEAA